MGLKHGFKLDRDDKEKRTDGRLKVAMFATIGYILPEYWRFPGYLSKFLDVKFADVPNGLSAFSKARRGCFEARKRPGTGPKRLLRSLQEV